MKKIRLFFLMFIFMNVVVVFNDIFAADSEDESEHFTKETFFKEKITDVNFAFYLKIKHFFPENIDLYNKNDWEELAENIYGIYCFNKTKGRNALREVFIRIRKGNPVDSNHFECLKNLASAIKRVEYQEKKRKSQDNNRTLVHVKNDHLNIVENKKSQEDKNDVISISDKKNSILKFQNIHQKNQHLKQKCQKINWFFIKKSNIFFRKKNLII